MRDDAKTQRRFGDVPAWAMKGPVDAKNYSYRAEAYASLRNLARGGFHPVIKSDGSHSLRAWWKYFDSHLRGRPWAFQALMHKEIKEMCVPEEMPQIFDPSFEPLGDWRNGKM